MRLPTLRPSLVALACSVSALAARADTAPRGLEAELPVRTPGCLSPAQLHLAAAADAVRAAWLPVRAVETAAVAGVKLTDDARVLAHLRRVLGAAPPAAWAAKAGRCQGALCALAAALDGSHEAALWTLAIGADGGPVASLDQTPFKGGAEGVWRADELRLLARALADLPPALRKQATRLNALRRIPDGENPYQGANAYSTRDGSIFFRDTVWKMPHRQQREVVAHELGHEIEFAHGPGYPISHSPDWLGITGWKLVGNDPNAKDAWRVPGSGPEATAIPSEEFPNVVADYRYTPRLVRATALGKYAYARQLYGGVEYLKLPADQPLDAAFARLGGPLAAFAECGGMVYRSAKKPGWLQAELFVVRWKKAGGSQWAKWAQGSFVTRSPCLGMVLEKLVATPEWKELSCSRDEEELSVAAAARLEDVWGSIGEGAAAVARVAPAGAQAACLQRGDLSLACLGGPQARPIAEAEARRIAAELQPQKPLSEAERAALVWLLLATAPLAPAEEDLTAAFPVLGSAPDFFAACLGGAVEISSPAGKAQWRYWVKNPPANDVRGFPGPLWTEACHRDWAAWLKGKGVTLPAGEPIFSTLAYQLKNQAGSLVGKFDAAVLQQWEALRAACGIPANTKATPAQQPCAAAFLQQRLDGLVPPAAAPALAKQLAAQLRGP